MTENTKQPRAKGLFLPPFLQLFLSVIGLCISLLAGALFIAAGFMGFVGQNLVDSLSGFFSTGFSTLLIGGLFLLPLVQAVQQLTGKETHFSEKRYLRFASILMMLWAPLILLGNSIAQNETVSNFLLPPLKFVMIASPILFLIELARRDLSHPEGGGAGVFTFGVMLTQPITMVIEIVSLLVIGIVALGWVNTQPALLDEVTRLGQRLMDTQLDTRMMEQILLPYLQKPGVILSMLLVGAGLIPLIEELLKPLALWVMAGRKIDEPAGFVLGLYAGGTFALLESLGMAASAVGQDWASIIVARVGTGILHVTTAALMGWGLAAAWSKRKYFQLGVTFLVSFTLHAVWNMLGIFWAVQQVSAADSGSTWLSTGLVALAGLAVIMVLILLAANRHLRKNHSRGYHSPSLISAAQQENIQPAGDISEDLEKLT